MTHTHLLDAWVYYQEGSVEEPAPKPIFEVHPAVLSLVDFLQDGKKPGWFRFSRKIRLILAEDAQESLARGIKRLITTTKNDRQPHNFFVGFAGVWGYPSLFIGTQPAGMTQTAASHRLATYGTTKKHQIQSDRALIVLFDQRGSIRSVRYDNSPPGDRQDLDALSDAMGLLPPEFMARPIPPSARRATKRLNAGKKKRRHR